jgi:crotonobetainyl-CoA:carnitine CoA-transferase CaiB-like acyl-CoA transferase
VENREDVDGMVTAFTLSMSRERVLEQCVAGDVPIAPVYSIAEVFNDPQYIARETIKRVSEPAAGEIAIPNVVPRLSGTPGTIASLGPSLGDANLAVYGEMLGLSAEEIARLKDAGVI